MKILAFAATALLAAAPQGDDLGKRLRETWTSAADWLVTQQDASGAWKMTAGGQSVPSPSYTGLIITSLANAPAEIRAKYKEPMDKAVAYLVSRANEDGSFGEGPTGGFMKTYTTGIALMALGSVDRERHAQKIRGAQAYLKHNQMKEGVNRGGSGYGDDAPTVGKDGKPPRRITERRRPGFVGHAIRSAGTSSRASRSIVGT